MKRNRDFYECDSYLVSEVDQYCRDARESMESNWTNDYPWDSRDAVENYMSRHGFRVEALLFAY